VFSFFKKKQPPQSAPLTPAQDAFLAACTQEYNEKLEHLNRDWGFAGHAQWGFDQLTGLFTLERKDGSKVLADGQIIGSYSSTAHSWEWAWNNPHVEAAMKRDVELVRAFGEKEKLEYLQRGTVPAPDKLFGMYLSGIAAKVIGSEGVFAGDAGPILVFVSLKNLRHA
jgi:hypothetical protein